MFSGPVFGNMISLDCATGAAAGCATTVDAVVTVGAGACALLIVTVALAVALAFAVAFELGLEGAVL